MFEFKLRIYFRRKFDINIFFRKYSLSSSLFQFFPFYPFLISFANFSLGKSRRKREKLASPFALDPLFFRTLLRMLARPPWRTTIKVMGSEYLEPDIPSHERFGAPSNLRATAFPPFLDCSRLLSSKRFRSNGVTFQRVIRWNIFFRKLCCRKH